MNVTKAMQKTCLAAIAAALALAAAAMPTRSELKKVQSVVNELMADDIAAMKSGRLKAPQVAANAEKLAGEAQSEAAKFLLYKGAFGLYVQGGSYDEAIRAIDRLTEAVKDVPDSVLAEILRDKLKRIPKKNGSAIFNLYDSVCRRMNAAKERERLEKQVKAKPADKDARRLLAVRCAQAGDWKAAREHFAALGGDEAAAVKAETSDPAAAANFWWGFKPDDVEDDDTFREYAASLYRKAIADGSLAGLKLVLAKKRLAEVSPAAEQNAAPQKSEPAAEAPKREVAAKQPAREEAKPVARAAGGKRVDWSLPKNFKGTKSLDFDLGGGETMTFFAVPAGKTIFGAGMGQGLPAHEIRITYPFWIARLPLTSRQFRLAGIDVPPGRIGGAMFEEKFADDKDALILAPLAPDYATMYFNWLNEKFGASLPKGWVFRPPTQGERLQISPLNIKSGYKQYKYLDNKEDWDSWLSAVHAKGLFTDSKTFQDIQKLRWQLKLTPDALFVGASKALREKNLFVRASPELGLDRISMQGVDVQAIMHAGRGIYNEGFTPHLTKAIDYKPTETDPFRYVADGTHNTWVSWGPVWAPLEAPMPLMIRVAVGPDYVGEWRAKNGK